MVLDTNAKPTESKIAIYIPDATYGQDDDLESWEKKSARFREELEREFQLSFVDADIGPGASVPAFVTSLFQTPWPYLAAGLLWGFFQGKKINENLEAWSELYKKIKPFFRHQPHFDRQGAAILAVEGLRCHLGGTPRSLELLGYTATSVLEGDEARNVGRLSKIEDTPPEMFLGVAIHVFDIRVDDKVYQVFVERQRVDVTELTNASR